MALVARLTSYADFEEQRFTHRRALRLEVPVSGTTAGTNALIYNLSARGLLLESAAPLGVGDSLVVDMPEAGAVAAEVIWIRDGFAGCEFERALSAAAVSAALLQSQPQQRSSVSDAVAASPGYALDESPRDEPAWVRALAIVALVLASAIAVLFILALLRAPFALQ